MRTGRPPKPPDERRDDDVKIPLTAAEKAIVWEAADIDGTKPITWSRKMILDAAKRRLKRTGRAE